MAISRVADATEKNDWSGISRGVIARNVIAKMKREMNTF